MELTWGYSRIVVFVGPFVVKIARVNLIRPFTWVLGQLLKRGEPQERERMLGKMRDPGRVVNKIFGFLANRRENELWQATKHPALMPTLWSCWLVNIQYRGTSVTEEELASEGPFGARIRLMRDGHILDDWNNPANYCRWQGAVLMCDYGHEDMEVFVSRPQRNLVLAK